MAEKVELIITLENGQFVVKSKETEQAIGAIGKKTQVASSTSEKGFTRMGAAANRFKNILSSFTKVGLVGLALGFLKFGKDAIKASAQMEQMQVAFSTMLGSTKQAKILLKDLRDFSAKTPLQFAGLAENTKTLLAFGIEGENVMDILKMLGDVSGGSQEKLNSLALAFGQMSSTGKLMGQDLLQMINAGFSPLQEISRTTGESLASLKDKMSKGQITVEQVTGAFKSATSEGGRFFGMLEKQSRTLSGLWSTLKDNFQLLLLSIGDKLAPAFKNLIGAFTAGSKSGSIFGKVLGKVADTAALLINSISAVVVSLKYLVVSAQKAGLEVAKQQAEARAKNAQTISEAMRWSTEVARLENEINKTISDQNDLREQAKNITNAIKGNIGDFLGLEKEATKELEKQSKITPGKPGEVGISAGKGGKMAGAAAELDKTDQLHKQLIEKYTGYASTIVGITSDMQSKISEIENMAYENRVAKAERSFDMIRGYIMSNVADEEERNRKLELLDKAQDLHLRIMQRKEAKRQKSMKIMEATINMLAGALAGFASAMIYPPPAGPIIGAAVAAANIAMGAATIAQIQQTPLPSYDAGIFDIPKTTMATVHAGETVLTKPITESIKAGEVALSGGEMAPNVHISKVYLNGREIAEAIDDERNTKGNRMGMSNYSYRSVYR